MRTPRSKGAGRGAKRGLLSYLGDLTHAATASSRKAEAPGGVLGLSPFATDLEGVTGSSFPKLVHWGLREEGDERER